MHLQGLIMTISDQLDPVSHQCWPIAHSMQLGRTINEGVWMIRGDSVWIVSTLISLIRVLISRHVRLFFSRNKFYPTRWFSCNRLKIPSYPFINLVLAGRVDFPSYPFIAYPFIREVRVINYWYHRCTYWTCKKVPINSDALVHSATTSLPPKEVCISSGMHTGLHG